jgi:hypothetical protein
MTDSSTTNNTEKAVAPVTNTEPLQSPTNINWKGAMGLDLSNPSVIQNLFEQGKLPKFQKPLNLGQYTAVSQFHDQQQQKMFPQQQTPAQNTFTSQNNIGQGDSPSANTTQGQLSFWQNPYRIVRYHNLIASDPKAVLPSWLNKDVVNTAYNWMAYKNDYKPWTEWKALSADDPLGQTLKDVPEPTDPQVIVDESNKDEANINSTVGQSPDSTIVNAGTGVGTLKQNGSYYNLTGWEKTIYGLMGVGTGQLADQPYSNKAFGVWGQGVMQGLGVGLLAGNINPIVGLAAGLVVGGITVANGLNALPESRANQIYSQLKAGNWSSIPGAPGMTDSQKQAVINMYEQRATGNHVVYNNIMKWFNTILNVPVQAGEQVIGAAAQLVAGDNDFKDVLEHPVAALRAGSLAFEASGKQYNVALGYAGNGKVWDITHGQPQAVPMGNETYGAAALDELRDKMVADPSNYQQYQSEFMQKMGVEGQINDFALQTALSFMIEKTTRSISMDALSKFGDYVSKNPELDAKFNGDAIKAAVGASKGSGVVDALPFPVNSLVEGIAKSIDPETKLRQSSGFMGAYNYYKTFLLEGTLPGSDHYVAPKDFSSFEKWAIGLDDIGKVKDLEARIGTGKFDPSAWLENTRSLSPVAKAFQFEGTIIDRLKYMAEAADGDVQQFQKMISAASKADPSLTGEAIGAILNPQGEKPLGLDPRWFNSPIGSTVAEGFKKISDSGMISELFSMFDRTQANRSSLNNSAKLFDMTPGELIKNVKDNYDFDGRLAAILSDPNIPEDRAKLAQGFDVNDMKIQIAPFASSKDPVPYSSRQMTTYIAEKLGDQFDDYLIQRYGIKEDSLPVRFSAMMKKATSLLLLGFNPRYLIYNEFNNILTRAVDGASGMFKINSINDKYDIVLGNASSLSGDVMNANGFKSKINERNNNARGQKAMDVVNKATGGISKLFNKVSTTGLSGSLENLESAQTMASSFMQTFSQFYKPELTDYLKSNLPIDLQDRLVSVAKSAGKVEDLDGLIDSIATQKVFTHDNLAKVATDFANAQNNKGITEDVIKDVLTKTGIIDDLVSELDSAKTDSDVARAFEQIKSQQDTYMNQLMQSDITSRIEDAKSKVAAEGIQGAIDILYDTLNYRDMEIQSKWRGWDSTWAMKGLVSKETFNDLINSQRNRDATRFDGVNQYMESTYKGLFEASKGNKGDISKWVDGFSKLNKLYEDFFSTVQSEQNKLSDPGLDFENFGAAKLVVDNNIEKAYQELRVREKGVQAICDQAILDISGGNADVANWVAKSGGLRDRIAKSMSDFREYAKTIDPSDRGIAYNKYIIEEYLPLTKELKEANFDAGRNIPMKQSALDMLIDSPDAIAKRNDYIAQRASEAGIPVNASLDEKQAALIKQFNNEWDEKVLANIDVVGNNPLGSTVEPQFDGMQQWEANTLFIDPILDAMKQRSMAEVNNPAPREGIDPESIPEIQKWISQTKTNLQQAKYASWQYAKKMREFTMLDYSKKTNYDNFLNTIFPYQFWFTHTMRNWLIRSIDRPALYATFFRYKQMQQRLENTGIPARLQGKIAIPLAGSGLPDWMGDSIYIDPMSQLFPFTGILQPFTNNGSNASNVQYDTIDLIKQELKDGVINQSQSDDAINNKTGKIWEEAYTKAFSQSDMSNPVTMASMMIQPAMWLQQPIQALQGKTDEIAQTPLSKTSASLQHISDKAGLPSAIGDVLGAPSWLETNARKAMGMSPAVARYGQYGDYYIERELSNMAFDGTISKDDATTAMIQHSGPAFDAAMKRVDDEIDLKQPLGMTADGLQGLIQGEGSMGGASARIFGTIFPDGILPTGELKYYGLRDQYSKAWDQYNAGDKTALNKFFEDHPEYEVRSALKESDPTVRLQQYLIGNIWDKYMNSSAANKIAINNALGQDFSDSFLSKSTADSSSIPLDKLVAWSRQLNLTVPKTDDTSKVEIPADVTKVQQWSDKISQVYQNFTTEREKLFPNWYTYQTEYMGLSKTDRKSFLKKFPELQDYYNWKDKYETAHPEVTIVLASKGNTITNGTGSANVTSKFDPALTSELKTYYSDGTQMTTGAWQLLFQEWQDSGSKYGDFTTWMKDDVQPAITGVPYSDPSLIWTDKNSAAYDSYKTKLATAFPNYATENKAYYALSSSAERKTFVQSHPDLKDAWAWKDQYKIDHPEVVGILNYVSKTYGN